MSSPITRCPFCRILYLPASDANLRRWSARDAEARLGGKADPRSPSRLPTDSTSFNHSLISAAGLSFPIQRLGCKADQILQLAGWSATARIDQNLAYLPEHQMQPGWSALLLRTRPGIPDHDILKAGVCPATTHSCDLSTPPLFEVLRAKFVCQCLPRR